MAATKRYARDCSGCLERSVHTGIGGDGERELGSLVRREVTYHGLADDQVAGLQSVGNFATVSDRFRSRSNISARNLILRLLYCISNLFAVNVFRQFAVLNGIGSISVVCDSEFVIILRGYSIIYQQIDMISIIVVCISSGTRTGSDLVVVVHPLFCDCNLRLLILISIVDVELNVRNVDGTSNRLLTDSRPLRIILLRLSVYHLIVCRLYKGEAIGQVCLYDRVGSTGRQVQESQRPPLFNLYGNSCSARCIVISGLCSVLFFSCSISFQLHDKLIAILR